MSRSNRPGRRVAFAALLGAATLAACVAAEQDVERRAPNKWGQPAPWARTPGAIRVCTYNVLNLFDREDDPALTGDIDDKDMMVSDDRCRAIAAAIRRVDADIIALQEVESIDTVRWFRDTFLADAGYDHIVSEDVGYYRGVECSLMSRFPVTDVQVWPNQSLEDVERHGVGWTDVPRLDRPLTYQRSPLRVTVKVKRDYDLTLYVLHHKAGGGNKWHREAEALRTMEKVRTQMHAEPSRNIIVLGDFNAAPWDRSLRVYLEGGLIDTLAHRNTYNKSPEHFFYKTHESGYVKDYILLNSAAHREFVIGSAHVYGTLFDEDYDWRKDPFPPGYASDHYPVIIDLVPRDLK